jgi:hypothetical protein
LVAGDPSEVVPSAGDERALFIAKAKAFEKIGAHLEASFYLEAALAKGSDERETLPRLITALVRSNRLRAARKYLDRFARLEPHSQNIKELRELLTRFAPRDSSPIALETEP